MKQILLLFATSLVLFTSGCRDNIDEVIRQGTFEAAYYYHSGAMPAGRFVTITIVINKNGGILKREERSVSNTGKNKEALAQFTVSGADLKKLHAIIEQQGYYELKSTKIEDPDARTVYLKVRAGSAQYIREESPVASMASNPDRQKFMAVISEFNAFVRERLPAVKKRLVDY
jgi:hypothetical protein